MRTAAPSFQDQPAELFQALIERSPCSSFLFIPHRDSDRQVIDFECTCLNSAAQRLFRRLGLSVRVSLWHLNSPWGSWVQMLQRVLDSEEDVRLELVLDPHREAESGITGTGTFHPWRQTVLLYWLEKTQDSSAAEAWRRRVTALEGALSAARAAAFAMSPEGELIEWHGRLLPLAHPEMPRRRNELLLRIHPEDRPKAESFLSDSSASERVFQLRLSNGQETHVCELSGRTEQFLEGGLWTFGLMQECTERVQWTERLRAAEEHYRLAALATHDVLWELDLLSQTVTWGEATGDVLGYAPADMGSALDWWSDRIHPEDRNRVVESLDRVVLQGGDSWRAEYRFLHSQGHYLHILDRGFITRNPRGLPIRMVGSMMDISERMAALERLADEAKLRERFMAVLGHDLRNPLNAIQLTARALRHSEHLPQTAAGQLARLESSACRMAKMISELLDFTRARLGGGIPIQAGETDLHAVCLQVVNELEAAYPGRTIQLEMEGSGKGLFDAGRLTQALSNLVGNALEHGAETSPVTVRCLEANEGWRVEVHNDGKPIPETLRPHLFEPFRRGSPSPQAPGASSLGLGLFIAYQIVQSHRGRLGVKSTALEGTTFVIELPRMLLPDTLSSAEGAKA